MLYVLCLFLLGATAAPVDSLLKTCHDTTANAEDLISALNGLQRLVAQDAVSTREAEIVRCVAAAGAAHSNVLHVQRAVVRTLSEISTSSGRVYVYDNDEADPADASAGVVRLLAAAAAHPADVEVLRGVAKALSHIAMDKAAATVLQRTGAVGWLDNAATHADSEVRTLASKAKGLIKPATKSIKPNPSTPPRSSSASVTSTPSSASGSTKPAAGAGTGNGGDNGSSGAGNDGSSGAGNGDNGSSGAGNGDNGSARAGNADNGSSGAGNGGDNGSARGGNGGDDGSSRAGKGGDNHSSRAGNGGDDGSSRGADHVAWVWWLVVAGAIVLVGIWVSVSRGRAAAAAPPPPPHPAAANPHVNDDGAGVAAASDVNYASGGGPQHRTQSTRVQPLPSLPQQPPHPHQTSQKQTHALAQLRRSPSPSRQGTPPPPYSPYPPPCPADAAPPFPMPPQVPPESPGVGVASGCCPPEQPPAQAKAGNTAVSSWRAYPVSEFELVSGTEGWLGSGSYGEVRRAQWRTTGTSVALKQLHFLRAMTTLAESDQASIRKQFDKECEANCNLQHHPNVVAFYGVAVDTEGKPAHLVLECLEGGTLSQAVHNHGPLAPVRCAEILRQVAHGLAHIHSHGIIHCDVKSANVLLDGSGRAKISDLGEAKLLWEHHSQSTRRSHTTGVGTPVYMAPEMRLSDQPRTTMVDMFSFGVLVAEVSAKRVPSPIQREMNRDPTTQQYTPIPEMERRKEDIDAVPAPFLDLVKRCLSDDPCQRCTAADAIDMLKNIR